MTTATSQYLYITMHYPISVSRMGAQVIAGVSFIGAGAIMMTKWQRVRGLTTAAGLWVVAIVGLCCGTAFYEGAVYATVLVLIAEVFFSKLEYRLLRGTKEVTVYAEYAKPSCLEDIVSQCHTLGVKVVDLEVTKKVMQAEIPALCCPSSPGRGPGRRKSFRSWPAWMAYRPQWRHSGVERQKSGAGRYLSRFG